MLFDVVILPSAKLWEKIGRKIRRATRGMKTVFVVDNKKLIPHLTLYLCKVNDWLQVTRILKQFKFQTLGEKGRRNV